VEKDFGSTNCMGLFPSLADHQGKHTISLSLSLIIGVKILNPMMIKSTILYGLIN
jgi:hypothetical protein